MSLFVVFVCILVIIVWALLMIFRKLRSGFQLQHDVPLFYPAKNDAVWTCGLSVGHGNLSMAVLFSSTKATLIDEKQ